MSEWRNYKVKDICSKMGDAPFGANLKTKDYVSTGKVVIQGKNISGRTMKWNDLRFITQEKFDSLPKHQVTTSALVFPKVGTIGKVGIVTPYQNEKEFLLSTNSMMIEPDSEKAHSDFVYYYFSWTKTRKKIELESTSSVQPVFNFTALKNFPINLPPLPEQKAIAKILGDLDDKIELNRKMNQTLEEMAQALFKSWFEDFDPVIDNAFAAGPDSYRENIPEELQILAKKRSLVAEGKKLLHTNSELAQLFPDSFLFNEVLGKWIPEGWEVKKIEDAATIVGGGTPSTKIQEYYCENGIPWMSPKDLSGYNWKYIGKGASDITELGLQKSSAKLMPKGSVLFSSRAPIGYIAIAENEVCTNQGFKSLVPNKGVPTEYLFQFLKANANEIEAVATGSTFKEVSGSALKGISILIPAKNIIEEFTMKLEASNKRSLIIQKQTETLVKLRDTLLPQLISGKLKVPEAMLKVEKMS